jgi:hypothetical protein
MGKAMTAGGNQSTPGAFDKSTVFFWLIIIVISIYCLPLILLAKDFVINIGLATPIDPGQNS